MSQTIRIDTRCTGCRLCALVCPMRVFTPQIAGPPIIGATSEGCIVCGHCVAVCPVGAISVGQMTAESCRPADTSLLPTFKQFAELAAQRRSVRSFQKTPVSRENLDRLFKLLQVAPTAKNYLPLKWTVINDAQATAKIAEIVIDGMRQNEKLQLMVAAWDAGYDWILRSAPCLIFAHTDDQALWTVFDSAIAAEMIDLAAPLLGLGCCWAGFFIRAVETNPILRRHLGLNETDRIGAALMLGLPDKEVYKRIPNRPAPNIRFFP